MWIVEMRIGKRQGQLVVYVRASGANLPLGVGGGQVS